MSKKLAIAVFFLLFSFVFAPTKSFAGLNDFGASEIFSSDSAKILTKEARTIVRGEVKDIKSYIGINDVVYTRVYVLVNEVIKGKVSKKNITIEYKESGTDDFGLLTEDAPYFEQGEDVILFLTNSFWRKNVYYLVRGSSGKYAVCANNTIIAGSSCDEEKQTDENTFSGDKNKDDTAIDSADAKKETLDELLGEIKTAE